MGPFNVERIAWLILLALLGAVGRIMFIHLRGIVGTCPHCHRQVSSVDLNETTERCSVCHNEHVVTHTV